MFVSSTLDSSPCPPSSAFVDCLCGVYSIVAVCSVSIFLSVRLYVFPIVIVDTLICKNPLLLVTRVTGGRFIFRLNYQDYKNSFARGYDTPSRNQSNKVL